MGEADIIAKTPFLGTRESILKDLTDIGLIKGQTVIVHSSLSSLGWVCGGSIAVVQALMDVLTPDGTLVMPSHSGDLSDPAKWEHPPVPAEWIPVIRETMPAYHPAFTPTRGMGVIVDTVLRFPGVLRSDHPALSFSAWGKYANEITSNHPLEFAMGENSPLGKIYRLDGWVLLLGVGFGNNTSFHLAEHRVPDPPIATEFAPIQVDGSRVWKEYRDIAYDDSIFEKIGEAFEQTGAVKVGKVAQATIKLFRQRPAVDFAREFISNRRKLGSQDSG